MAVKSEKQHLNLKPYGEYCHEKKKATYSKHHFRPWNVGNVL